MRAIHVVDHSGPETALRLVDTARPPQLAPLFSDEMPVRIAVHAAGVTYPDLLHTEGKYQEQPELPFVPGAEVSGTVIAAPSESGLAPGDAVAAYCHHGGWAEEVLAPASLTYTLPAGMDHDAGAAMVSNYHTAYAALVLRGGLTAGERVLVHGAAGGLGSAIVQLASALGAEVLAVVSSSAKAEYARACGARAVFRVGDEWRRQIKESFPEGVQMVLDPVGGSARSVDSLRVLAQGGRYVVLGFTSGEISQIPANRLLLRNLTAVGVAWGDLTFGRQGVNASIHEKLEPFFTDGRLSPLVSDRFELQDAAAALKKMASRDVIGRVVLLVR
ncbi:NADPH:quinone oxidoreductase family protein [Ornithinimicrobium cavernae]|uniref:NADPH:quinone oxidoreductase family protein n=1 Tax=Ornithinimicrobium cavernae TaxID=2666047 RepID=UPI000D68AED6|nr:NADPH:quinone oxidoreductase family protein [Ornithinimicrobium cavernae]